MANEEKKLDIALTGIDQFVGDSYEALLRSVGLESMPGDIPVASLQKIMSATYRLAMEHTSAANTDAMNRLERQYQDRIEQLGKEKEGLLKNLVGARKKIDQLRADVVIDGLTGIHNKKFFNSTLDQRVSEIDRNGSTLGYILFDIDHFKQVNDVYGHESGDGILKTVGSVLKEIVRSSDYKGRWGGEEFYVLCPEADIRGITTLSSGIMDAVNKETRNLAKQGDEGEYPIEGITISVGYGIFSQGNDVNVFKKAVDSALYESKAAGRDRMTLYDGKGCVTIGTDPHK